MLHLFKKTYLQTHDFIDSSKDRIVVSSSASNLDPTYVSLGEIYHQTNGVNNLIGKDKPFKNWFELFTFAANTDKQFVLYADQSAFCKIAAAWFKMLLPNIDSSSAYNLIKSHFAKEKLIGGIRSKSYTLFKKFEPSEALFKTSFDSVEVDANDSTSFIQSVKDNLSVEFLLSSWISGLKYKDELKTTLKFLVERQLQQVVMETQQQIYKKALKDQLRDALGTKAYDFDTVEDIIADPAIKLFIASSFVNEAGTSLLGSHSAINLKNITASDADKLNDLVNIVYPQLECKEYFREYLNLVSKDSWSDEDLDWFIKNEAKVEEVFWADADLENINIYFIDHILENISNKANLNPYVIR